MIGIGLHLVLLPLLIVESKKNVLFFSHAARGENVIKKYSCQEWDSNPRLHSETRTLIPASSGKGIPLESGAFDRSAILTTYNYSLFFSKKPQQVHKRKQALFYEQQHGLMSMKAGLTYQRDVSEQKPILTEIWCKSYWLRETIWVSFYLHEKEKLKSIKKNATA